MEREPCPTLMKKTLLKLGIVALLIANAEALQAKFVTLVIGGNTLTNEVTIGTNDVAVIKAWYDGKNPRDGEFYLLVTKGAHKFQLYPVSIGSGSNGKVLAGPATITLRSANEQPRGELKSAEPMVRAFSLHCN